MVLNLLDEFSKRDDLVCDLLLIRANSAHLASLPDNINIINLGTKHSGTSLFPVMRYLRQYQPDAMLVAKDRAGRIALLARKLSGSRCRICLRLGTNLQAAMKYKSSLSRGLRYFLIRRIYPWVDNIIAVSQGVADDTRVVSRLPAERIHVVRNPVVTDRMQQLALAPVTHEWLINKTCPVILGVGRMTTQKGFDVLIQAFARLHATRKCRLIILGDGKLLAAHQQLVEELGVSEAVDFPGFSDNPYPSMKHADVFVLSSRWEGSPNVLTEALAMGTPVVATDCPSGPREILQGGRIAPLIPMDDVSAMADAMAQMLDSPPPTEQLRSAVSEYNVHTSAQHYLELLGLVKHTHASVS